MGVESNKGTRGNTGKTVIPFSGDLGGGRYSSPEAAQPTVDYYKNEATYFNDTNNKSFDHIRTMHQHANAISENSGSVFAMLASQHLADAAQAHQDAAARGDYDYSAVEPHVTAAADMMKAAHDELANAGTLTIGHQRMMDKFHDAHADYQRTVSPASITKSDTSGYRINLDTDYRLRTGDKSLIAEKKRDASRSPEYIARKAAKRKAANEAKKAAKLKGEI